MKTPSSIKTLLNKEMTRKEFLNHVAALAVVVSGGGLIAQSLGQFGQSAGSASSTSYGMSAYGGSKTQS